LGSDYAKGLLAQTFVNEPRKQRDILSLSSTAERENSERDEFWRCRSWLIPACHRNIGHGRVLIGIRHMSAPPSDSRLANSNAYDIDQAKACIWFANVARAS
jgi:hypothetical protein